MNDACSPSMPADRPLAYQPLQTKCSPGSTLIDLKCFEAVNLGKVKQSECAPASLPTASSSLTHACRMDGFCNQNADQLGYLAGPSLLTVYVGVVECASASPYTYSTHRFPDERTPIEATPLQPHLRSLGWVWVWVWDWVHIPPHTLLSFSPPSFHTISLSLAFTSA